MVENMVVWLAHTQTVETNGKGKTTKTKKYLHVERASTTVLTSQAFRKERKIGTPNLPGPRHHIEVPWGSS